MRKDQHGNPLPPRIYYKSGRYYYVRGNRWHTLSKDYTTALIQRARDKAGVFDVTIHDIRAKAITDAEAIGLDPQALAGHSSRAMTERYLRLKKTAIVRGPCRSCGGSGSVLTGCERLLTARNAMPVKSAKDCALSPSKCADR